MADTEFHAANLTNEIIVSRTVIQVLEDNLKNRIAMVIQAIFLLFLLFIVHPLRRVFQLTDIAL